MVFSQFWSVANSIDIDPLQYTPIQDSSSTNPSWNCSSMPFSSGRIVTFLTKPVPSCVYSCHQNLSKLTAQQVIARPTLFAEPFRMGAATRINGRNHWKILWGLRKHSITITADVGKIYGQILICRDHRQFRRIIWRESVDSNKIILLVNSHAWNRSSVKSSRDCSN